MLAACWAAAAASPWAVKASNFAAKDAAAEARAGPCRLELMAAISESAAVEARSNAD